LTVSIVEVTTFRLADGVRDESFLALDRRVQTELVPNQPGFMRRTTARHGDDWLVVTLWSTEDAAAAFDRAAEGHPLQVALTQAVEAGTFHLTRYITLD
jgi:heme-degrading monooxygenase HmoA